MINTGLGLGQCQVDVRVGYFLLINAQLKRHTTQFKTTYKINIQEYQFIKFVFFYIFEDAFCRRCNCFGIQFLFDTQPLLAFHNHSFPILHHQLFLAK